MIERNNITGILLAGGMSRRMGIEKGTFPVGNALLYQYPLDILEKSCGEILISTCKPSLFSEPHKKVCDEIKGIGPLGGIYSCLKESSNDINLVLSYDMPLVNQSLFRLLVKETGNHDIVLPAMHMERPEPLCGIYRKRNTALIEEMISKHDFAVNQLLTKCSSRVVLIEKEMECWHPDLFLNINRQEDLLHLPSGFRRQEK